MMSTRARVAVVLGKKAYAKGEMKLENERLRRENLCLREELQRARDCRTWKPIPELSIVIPLRGEASSIVYGNACYQIAVDEDGAIHCSAAGESLPAERLRELAEEAIDAQGCSPGDVRAERLAEAVIAFLDGKL